MGPATLKGNEAEMKQPSDIPTPRFEHGGSDLWSNTLPLDHGGTQLGYGGVPSWSMKHVLLTDHMY